MPRPALRVAASPPPRSPSRQALADKIKNYATLRSTIEALDTEAVTLAERIRLARPAAEAFTREMATRARCAEEIKENTRDVRWLPPHRASAITDAHKAAQAELAALPLLDRQRRNAGEDAVE
jgi:hypothetical protein